MGDSGERSGAVVDGPNVLNVADDDVETVDLAAKAVADLGGVDVEEGGLAVRAACENGGAECVDGGSDVDEAFFGTVLQGAFAV